MTGILIPEMVIYQTLENITEYIRRDMAAHADDESVTVLYRLLGLDDENNPMKMNRYNYFVQAKKIFSNPKNLSVNFGYNFEVAKIISFHIILPSEQQMPPAIGEDEGYLTETDEDGNTQLKFCQMLSSTYQIMITSDNMSEVNLVYHVYKSLMVALVPHLSLKGLLNPKMSGNDIVFQDDTIPMGIFHRVLNLSFEYELVIPQILIKGLVTSINFNGSPIIPKEKDEYPSHRVEPSRPGGKIPEDGRVFPSSHVVNGLIGENNTLKEIRVCVTDGYDKTLPDIVVELRSRHYLYYAVTDKYGIAHFPTIANEVYTVTLAKSGYNQGSFYNILFDSPDTYIKYSLVSKTIWEGWYSDTHPILYVDIHDAGNA